jgi:hypothetical protein
VTDQDGEVLTRARNRTFERDGDPATHSISQPEAHSGGPPSSAALETVVSAIAVEFALRHGLRGDVSAWVARRCEARPGGVRLGEATFDSGWLPAMRDAGAPAAAVFNGLAAQVGEG